MHLCTSLTVLYTQSPHSACLLNSSSWLILFLLDFNTAFAECWTLNGCANDCMNGMRMECFLYHMVVCIFPLILTELSVFFIYFSALAALSSSPILLPSSSWCGMHCNDNKLTQSCWFSVCFAIGLWLSTQIFIEASGWVSALLKWLYASLWSWLCSVVAKNHQQTSHAPWRPVKSSPSSKTFLVEIRA